MKSILGSSVAPSPRSSVAPDNSLCTVLPEHAQITAAAEDLQKQQIDDATRRERKHIPSWKLHSLSVEAQHKGRPLTQAECEQILAG